MLIDIVHIKMFSLFMGGLAVILYLVCRKKEPNWAKIPWLDLFLNVVYSIVIFFGIHFSLYMGIYFFGSVIVVVESESEHHSYMHFGSSENYLIELEPREVYVHNKMNRKLLVHSLPSDNGLTKDWVVLNPDAIAKVHAGPQYFFEKTPSFYRGKSLRNAVDYYQQ
ncbi:MAG: hypothetical protein K6E73_03115 [Bacteroidales bacterium]|nr:hypothetical protein [Bacteroidales bacterium]